MPAPPVIVRDDGISWGDYSWDDEGYIIEPDDENEINISSGITEDSSLFLPENADIKAIYDAIKTQPEWTNYIKYFNANDPANSSLTIKIGDMPVGHEKSSAVTVPSSPTNSATIIINKNNIRQLRPTNIALVILHEGIHAKLFSLLKRLAKNLLLTTTEKVDVNNLRRMIRLYGSKHGEHTYIGRYYLNSLIRGMRAFQTLSPAITDLHYKALIFSGLGDTQDFFNFRDNLPNGKEDLDLMLLEIAID